jgi:hypothetical protein
MVLEEIDMNADILQLLRIAETDQLIQNIYAEYEDQINEMPEVAAMASVIRASQEKAKELEQRAKRSIIKFERVKKEYEANYMRAEMLDEINLNGLSDEKLRNLNEELETILKNLSNIEKKLQLCNSEVEKVLVEFETAKQTALIARAKRNEIGEAFIEKSDFRLTGLKQKRAEYVESVDKRLLGVY